MRKKWIKIRVNNCVACGHCKYVDEDFYCEECFDFPAIFKHLKFKQLVREVLNKKYEQE